MCFVFGLFSGETNHFSQLCSLIISTSCFILVSISFLYNVFNDEKKSGKQIFIEYHYILGSVMG